MNTRYDEDEQQPERADADLTLGIGSLLSIFFGVVLICGIFFGFGYSMGRRNTSSATITPATRPTTPAITDDSAETTVKPQSSSAAFPPDSSNPTPDASKSTAKAQQQTAQDASAVSPAQSNDTAKPAAKPHPTSPTVPSTALAAVPFTHRAPLPTKPHAGIAAAVEPPPPAPEPEPGHPIMVQIAAVSRQEDAEVLAGALRKRGFSPQIRKGTADAFFHVQVGPFTDKTEAESMKQHLLADGYNAIVK